jgi:hypothetical protein
MDTERRVASEPERILADSVKTHTAAFEERREARKLCQERMIYYEPTGTNQQAEWTKLRTDQRFAKVAVEHAAGTAAPRVRAFPAFFHSFFRPFILSPRKSWTETGLPTVWDPVSAMISSSGTQSGTHRDSALMVCLYPTRVHPLQDQSGPWRVARPVVFIVESKGFILALHQCAPGSAFPASTLQKVTIRMQRV